MTASASEGCIPNLRGEAKTHEQNVGGSNWNLTGNSAVAAVICSTSKEGLDLVSRIFRSTCSSRRKIAASPHNELARPKLDAPAAILDLDSLRGPWMLTDARCMQIRNHVCKGACLVQVVESIGFGTRRGSRYGSICSTGDPPTMMTDVRFTHLQINDSIARLDSGLPLHLLKSSSGRPRCWQRITTSP